MSEMIDRIAKAIADNIQAGLPDGVTVDYHYAACAVAAAMRKPTEEMIEAAYKRDYYDDGLPPRATWEAMIGEALK